MALDIFRGLLFFLIRENFKAIVRQKLITFITLQEVFIMKKVFEKVKDAIGVTMVIVAMWIGIYKISFNSMIAIEKLIAYIGNKIYRKNHYEDWRWKEIMDTVKFKF